MPNWVLGNNVFTSTTDRWLLNTGATSKIFPINLTQSPAGADDFDIMWQSGVIKGFNVYVNANASTTDMAVQMYRGVYDGDVSHPITATTLLTIPAGESGYFCMDETTLTRAQRTWVKRDTMAIRFLRTGTIGGFSKITYAVCVEMTEEFLEDNDYDQEAEPPIGNLQVSH